MSVFNGDTSCELTRRQARLYTHLVDIWDVLRQAEQQDSFVRIARNVPCYYAYTQNVDDLTPGGRIKRFSLFTTDVLHLPLCVSVPNGSWCVNRTPNNPNKNAFHHVLGAALVTPGTERRPVNAQVIELMQDENAPLDLLNAYGLNG